MPLNIQACRVASVCKLELHCEEAGTNSSSSLGVTGEPLLGDDGARVPDGPAEVAELLVVRVTLVLVVGDGRRSVELHGCA